MKNADSSASATALLTFTGSDQATMSSQEISVLLECRHADVKRSIKRLASRGAIQCPPMAKVVNKQSLSPNNRFQIYVFAGEQGKRDSYVVIAQLSPAFTGRIVDRWLQLEAELQQAPRLPNFSNPADAARAWADQVDACQVGIR